MCLIPNVTKGIRLYFLSRSWEFEKSAKESKNNKWLDVVLAPYRRAKLNVGNEKLIHSSFWIVSFLMETVESMWSQKYLVSFKSTSLYIKVTVKQLWSSWENIVRFQSAAVQNCSSLIWISCLFFHVACWHQNALSQLCRYLKYHQKFLQILRRNPLLTPLETNKHHTAITMKPRHTT